ncbi:signaling mucin MSB2 [Rhypophila sp. PSN 637]
MRTTSLLAAALLAATAVAEQARPRIYFPRHVKRQFSNTTITSSSSLESQSSTPDLSLSAPKTLPRDESASESTNPRVTTIVVQSTIYVSPPAATGTANNTGSASSTDTTTADPSTSKEDVTSKPPADEPLPSSPSSDAPSTNAPSSEVPKSESPKSDAPSTEAPTSDAPKSDAPKSDAPKSDTPKSDAPKSDAPSSGGVPSSVVLPTTRTTSTSSPDTAPVSSEPPKPVESEDPSPSEPPLAANTTTSTEPPVSVAPPPTTTTTSTSGILLAPSGIVTTTSSANNPLEPIESIISSILNPPKPSNTTDPVPSQAPITTTSADTEPSLIPSLPPIISEPPTSTSTADQPPVSSLPNPGESSVTPDPQPESTTTPIPVESNTPSVSSVTPPPVSPIPEPSSAPVPPPVSSNTTTSAVPPPPSTPPTSDGPSVTPPPDQPSSVLVPPPPVTLNTTTSANNTVPQVTAPTSVPTSLPPTTTPQTTTPPADDVTSVPPLSTITGTEGWATPTAIIVDDASTTVSGIIAPTSGSGIPTALPKAINPDTFGEPQPEDTTLIQIGFLNSLNYPFVSQNNQAAYQIFRLLPQALAYGSNFDLSKCRVMKLIPLDTRPSLGYLTTLAIASYPSNLIDALQMDIRLANSALYASGQPIVQNLTMQINSAIDITLGAGYGGGPGWDTGIPADPTDGPADPFGGEGNANNQTSAEKGATAGIVAGSVGIAAAYGAAMFIIARRYKRKKQAHRRASSISNPSEMQYNGRGSPAMMGGALLSRDFSTYGATSGAAAGERNSHGSGRSGAGNSGRTAYISAPVAAENSLGWN